MRPTELDESDLVRFFGVPPIEREQESPEVRGPITFRVSAGDLVLTVGFHTRYGDAGIDLGIRGSVTPLLSVVLGGILCVRVEGEPATLVLRGGAYGRVEGDPEIVDRATVSLHPLCIRMEDRLG